MFKSRNILRSIVGFLGLAAAFNMNATAPAVTAGPIHERPPATRKRGQRNGIKGIKGTNNTRYGAGLKRHFDSK